MKYYLTLSLFPFKNLKIKSRTYRNFILFLTLKLKENLNKNIFFHRFQEYKEKTV
jgi:hypothetical protein